MPQDPDYAQEIANLTGLSHGAAGTRETAVTALKALDYTTLSGDETPEDIRAFCAEAREALGGARPAAVCVLPEHVRTAKAALEGSGIKVATVVNFPDGTSNAETVAAETEAAVAAGADEIDVVLPYLAFMDGDRDHAADILLACMGACGTAAMKVIVESPVLAPEAGLEMVRDAARLAVDCGADFLKTSTGKSIDDAGNKRPETDLAQAAVLMTVAAEAQARGRPVGVKISGGVKSNDDAAKMLAMQSAIVGKDMLDADRFRIGASGLRAALAEVLAPTAAGAPKRKPTTSYSY